MISGQRAMTTSRRAVRQRKKSLARSVSLGLLFGASSFGSTRVCSPASCADDRFQFGLRHVAAIARTVAVVKRQLASETKTQQFGLCVRFARLSCKR